MVLEKRKMELNSINPFDRERKKGMSCTSRLSYEPLKNKMKFSTLWCWRGKHLFSSFNKHNTHRVFFSFHCSQLSAEVVFIYFFYITFVLCLCESVYGSVLRLSSTWTHWYKVDVHFWCGPKLNFLFFSLIPFSILFHYVWVLYH